MSRVSSFITVYKHTFPLCSLWYYALLHQYNIDSTKYFCLFLCLYSVSLALYFFSFSQYHLSWYQNHKWCSARPPQPLNLSPFPRPILPRQKTQPTLLLQYHLSWYQILPSLNQSLVVKLDSDNYLMWKN